MAKITEKQNKKVVTINESETLNETHLRHVVNALGAFADSKVISRVDPTLTSLETISHKFTYSKKIPTRVLQNALVKLQVKIK